MYESILRVSYRLLWIFVKLYAILEILFSFSFRLVATHIAQPNRAKQTVQTKIIRFLGSLVFIFFNRCYFYRPPLLLAFSKLKFLALHFSNRNKLREQGSRDVGRVKKNFNRYRFKEPKRYRTKNRTIRKYRPFHHALAEPFAAIEMDETAGSGEGPTGWRQAARNTEMVRYSDEHGALYTNYHV